MPKVKKTSTSQTKMSKVLVGLAFMVMTVVLASSFFVLARRLSWTLGWIYIGLIVLALTINFACLLRWNPELVRRRMRFSKFTKTWDKIWALFFGLFMIAVFVVAGFESRDEVSNTPGVEWLLGLTIFIFGWALATWSMVVNPFFEKTVRIQTEHGHRVIESGPYTYIRHPGYVGFACWMLSTPLLLASDWAFIPALLAVIGFVIRTALEDRMLRLELSGYTEYATRVRFRLFPGVW